MIVYGATICNFCKMFSTYLQFLDPVMRQGPCNNGMIFRWCCLQHHCKTKFTEWQPWHAPRGRPVSTPCI